MPKDEFDFDDPMELTGLALATDQDATEAMAECFIEEFMRLGYNHKQILALFRNRFYLGLHMVWRNRGEIFVRDRISEMFARWGRPILWPEIPGGSESPPDAGVCLDPSERTDSTPSLAPKETEIPDAGGTCSDQRP